MIFTRRFGALAGRPAFPSLAEIDPAHEEDVHADAPKPRRHTAVSDDDKAA